MFSNRKLKSNLRTCRFKHKLTLDDAQEYLLNAQKDTKRYKHPEDLELYLCAACQFLHIGHKKGSRKNWK